MVAIGRVVEVRGGRVRKDRHSKVYTSKGPKDRRVRLSALTAIEFYDVQDRLGYERPSEAVDWLMHKAKASIEALPLPIRPVITPCSQDLRIGARDPTLTGFKDEFSEAAKLQTLHHLGADHSINFLPSYHIDSSLSSLCDEYMYTENNSMLEMINYDFENSSADPSPMLEEDSRSGSHVQVCSLSKLFQSRELNAAMGAPIWRADSTEEAARELAGMPGSGLSKQ